jgi:hypothetical protein
MDAVGAVSVTHLIRLRKGKREKGRGRGSIKKGRGRGSIIRINRLVLSSHVLFFRRKGDNTWPAKLAKAAGVEVWAPLGFCNYNVINGTVEVEEKGTGGWVMRENKKLFGSHNNAWRVFKPKGKPITVGLKKE